MSRIVVAEKLAERRKSAERVPPTVEEKNRMTGLPDDLRMQMKTQQRPPRFLKKRPHQYYSLAPR